uniref:uncharacterized protein LOC120330817 n=1 Tax=Styela clava TaxID=7725 RepID=UPI00193963D3|nr:uncharacterized protein LOC120330817 [Styela clava]
MAHLENLYCREDDECYDGDYKCKDGSRCIRGSEFCDGKIDCSDGDDEILYDAYVHTKDDGIGCMPHTDSSGRFCLLPTKHMCDGNIHCPNAEDECGCRSSSIFCDGQGHCPFEIDECFCENNTRSDEIQSDDKCFQCLDGSRVISSTQVCDNVIHCTDLSDECLCVREQSLDLEALCQDIYGKNEEIQDTPMNCSLSTVDGCLFKDLICDGRFDEVTKRDEKFCPRISTDAVCSDADHLIELGIPRCNYECQFSGKRAVTCDGKLTCEQFDDECSDACENQPEFCRFVEPELFLGSNFVCGSSLLWGWDRVEAEEVCNGIPDCIGGNDELYCMNKFYCDSEPPIHIPIEKKCDLIPDCEDQSDELYCGNNTYDCQISENKSESCGITHFYCIDNGTTLYLDRRKQVCDGNEDCKSGVDECQNCTVGIFSDDDAMISSKPIIPFLWLISGCAVSGNILVIYISTKRLANYKKSSKMEINQNILVWNLAIADLLVGLYTSAISIQNIRLSENRYCLEDQRWRSSPECSMLGVMLLVGSEQSVLSLCIITGFRMKAVLRPMSRTRARSVLMCMALGWIVSIILSIIPIVPSASDYFTEVFWYSQNTFVTTINREDVPVLTERLLTMLNVSSTSSGWTLLENLVKNLNPAYIPERRFGFYSSHGVCLPRLFPDPSNDAAWGYSLMFILINFCAFIYIFVGYLIIYIKSTKTKIAGSSTASKTRAVALQRKVTRIVVTDFLCWMPICLMALLQLFGIPIRTELYVPVGTILIPINSALNPFLYTEIPDVLLKRFQIIQEWGRRFSSRFGSSTKRTELDDAIPLQATDSKKIQDKSKKRDEEQKLKN